MAKQSRDMLMAFARACGLNPYRVRSLTLTAEARDGILVANVVMYPEPTSDDLAMLVEAIEEQPEALHIIATEYRGDDGS